MLRGEKRVPSGTLGKLAAFASFFQGGTLIDPPRSFRDTTEAVEKSETL